MCRSRPEKIHTDELDHDGTPLPDLTIFNHGKPDERFPTMPNGRFAIEAAPGHLAEAVTHEKAPRLNAWASNYQGVAQRRAYLVGSIPT
jgi:hypothetical protein